MSAERPSMPPVRLNSEAELARDALAAPLLVRAVRLARWAGPDTRVGAGGELVEAQLPAAAEHLGLTADEEGAAYASEAWRLAVDTGLLDVTDPEEAELPDGADDSEAEGTVTAGENLALLTGGSPQDVLAIWLDGLDAVHADATAPVLDDFADLVGEDGSIDFEALDWDPEAEAEFLDGVLGNLYLLTLADSGAGDEPVPLPALAASMIVPDDMGEPTDDILEQVSEAMMRLDDQFRLLEPIGIVEYRPVDEALLVEEDESADGSAAVADDDVTRYGMVKLTPSGCTASAPACWRRGWTRPPWATSRARGPRPFSTASRTTRSPPPAPRSPSGSRAAAPGTRRRRPRSCWPPHAVRTGVRRSAASTASRPSPWPAPRRSRPYARCSTTRNSAAWPASGSRNGAPPTCPHRRRR